MLKKNWKNCIFLFLVNQKLGHQTPTNMFFSNFSFSNAKSILKAFKWYLICIVSTFGMDVRDQECQYIPLKGPENSEPDRL